VARDESDAGYKAEAEEALRWFILPLQLQNAGPPPAHYGDAATSGWRAP